MGLDRFIYVLCQYAAHKDLFSLCLNTKFLFYKHRLLRLCIYLDLIEHECPGMLMYLLLLSHVSERVMISNGCCCNVTWNSSNEELIYCVFKWVHGWINTNYLFRVISDGSFAFATNKSWMVLILYFRNRLFDLQCFNTWSRVKFYRNYSNLTLLLINAGGQKWPKACN